MKKQVGAVIVAAGKGSRMGTPESKQYLRLEGKPILIHTMMQFEQMSWVDEIVLVVGAQDVERCTGWVEEFNLRKVTHIVAGGAERQYSVYQGLLAANTEWVLIHDGVRPFVTEERVRACYEAAVQQGASVLAVPVKDTIKQVNEAGMIVHTPDRRSLWAIQTPQAFRRSDVLRAHEQAVQDQVVGTDDAMLVERLGIGVHVVEGEYTNIKITTPEDLVSAQFWLQQMREEQS
ncbi:2-C-methyl-D-erythritol 4-phosphate cytidylyltransferase [Paenibacillus selenitireducens]|uniref:2-C-methyl-D-erythritol 4-phosphate cytidylyltransferase n=1 Tax=Paenibacillus selenitireducens TaxID=1324314 RepID=A0A1T2WZT1_9BACL|nr:2-C-methyl-D-erythritol 4-phosphate cytidylyltransferase [Paenibacillus selenitireducens]OPA73139.1 2-C-methyl-D-erythritol 4-phosphate cytidylyltransferase [Paenibacillus selenitireducens]